MDFGWFGEKPFDINPPVNPELLAYLAEVDHRELYLDAAFPSMFAWCVDVLNLSEGATCKRIAAARAARQYPVILDYVRSGRLHLCGVQLLARHLAPDNCDKLLEDAAGLSKRDLEKLLAARFPAVTFKMVGVSQDPAYQQQIDNRCAGLANLELLGFIDQFRDSRLSRLLNVSWVMVNTSGREGLPNSFIEAAGHGCALVSELDPDEFTSQFGELVTEGDYGRALKQLLDSGAWRERGVRGRAYVQSINDPDFAITEHLQQYRAALAAKAQRSD